MAKYRKKPVVIEAVQWNGKNEILVMDFVGKGALKYSHPPNGYEHDHDLTDDLFRIEIPSREGLLSAQRNDFIIKGYTKEAGIHCWVCKPDYFKEAYELCEDQSTDYLSLYEIQDKVKQESISGRHY